MVLNEANLAFWYIFFLLQLFLTLSKSKLITTNNKFHRNGIMLHFGKNNYGKLQNIIGVVSRCHLLVSFNINLSEESFVI